MRRSDGALYNEILQEFQKFGAQLMGLSVTYKARVRADFSSGVRSGVNGTPTFFINGDRRDGNFDYETLVLEIQEKIGKQGNAVIA